MMLTQPCIPPSISLFHISLANLSLSGTHTTLTPPKHTVRTPSHALELVYAVVALIIPNMGEIERTKDFGFQYVDSPGTLILAHVARGLAGDQSEETK
ncbi:hypothetical protein E2C01_082826 [Portunus trituberculatus]|uniref:Uncharacterized protein n=1 Tax=Portunus trituberculatus TaxID=210409 RepID=A0A5B7J0B6_PORTR|nr:hypothetical protein [Portunus trituberculatus]